MILFLTISCAEDATIHAEVKLKRILFICFEERGLKPSPLSYLSSDPEAWKCNCCPLYTFSANLVFSYCVQRQYVLQKTLHSTDLAGGGEVGVVLQGLAVLMCFALFTHFLPWDRVKALEFWISLTWTGCLLFTSWKAVGAQAGALSAEIRAQQCSSTVVVKPSKTQGSGIMAFRWKEATVPESPVRWHW